MELVFGIQLGVIEGQNLTGLISGPHTGLESREADLADLDQDRESGRFLQFGGVACRGSELRNYRVGEPGGRPGQSGSRSGIWEIPSVWGCRMSRL